MGKERMYRIAAVLWSAPAGSNCRLWADLLNCSVPAVSNLGGCQSSALQMKKMDGRITSLKCIVGPGPFSIIILGASSKRAYVDFYLLPVGIFNRWVITLDPLVMNELRFTFSSATDVQTLTGKQQTHQSGNFSLRHLESHISMTVFRQQSSPYQRPEPQYGILSCCVVSAYNGDSAEAGWGGGPRTFFFEAYRQGMQWKIKKGASML